MRHARHNPNNALVSTVPLVALKVLHAGLNGTAKQSLSNGAATVKGPASANGTALFGRNSVATWSANEMLSGPARSGSGAVPSTESGPNSVATRNVSAMPSELARRSASAPTVSRSRAEERQRREAEQSGLRRERERQAGDRVKGGERMSQRREELRLARERLGPNERQRLRAAFDFRQARVTKARFEPRIGYRVPRHIHLFPVPREVISFFPYYSDYRYIVVEDEICIVDPRTYEIVDVIDQNYYRGGPRPEVAGLSLAPDEIALVRDSIPRDFPEVDVRLRLALGAELPGDVELYEFPAIVLDRISRLQTYRFLVAEGQIIIVDPRHRSIALVIDRV